MFSSYLINLPKWKLTIRKFASSFPLTACNKNASKALIENLKKNGSCMNEYTVKNVSSDLFGLIPLIPTSLLYFICQQVGVGKLNHQKLDGNSFV